MQKYLQNFQKLNVYSRKLKMCKSSLQAAVQKNYGKFAIVQSSFFLFKAFQRAIQSINPMTGSRSKYRFSRVKVK